ncbi:hypothetical protein [Tropicibacter sp. S64]|uniref:hypothetical protein n=1 Tax=Tropicibacter sp. S64 TaxID=3415122 RepID=UPI003C7E340E
MSDNTGLRDLGDIAETGVGLDLGVLPSGRRYAVLRPVAEMDRRSVHGALRHLAEAPGLGARMPTLWDFRGFDFASCNLAVCRRNVMGLSAIPDRAGALRACLVDSELGYGVLRMVQEVVGGCGVDDIENFHITYAIDDALGWLDSRLNS